MFAISHHSRVSQRRHVAWLALALCMWFIAIASHTHVGDQAPSHDPAHACSFCLSTPAAGTPSVLSSAAVRIDVATATHDEFVTSQISLALPEFYLSRGPPAV